jgi:hypothetical protein
MWYAPRGLLALLDGREIGRVACPSSVSFGAMWYTTGVGLRRCHRGLGEFWLLA